MRSVLLLFIATALSACAVGPDYRAPETPAPASFVSGHEPVYGPEEVQAEFWKGFNDAQLDALIQQALAANHDLRIAEANLRQVRALRGASSLDLAPTVTAGGGHTEAKLSERQLPASPAGDRKQDFYALRKPRSRTSRSR
jgi:outer membrane protein TolC